MNSTIELIFTVAGAALTLLAVYGAVRSDRKLFLSGIFYFSFLPLIGESMGYNADKAPIHILVIFMFLIQLALSLPNNITYGQDNAAANKLSAKIAIALLLINVGGVVYIFCLHPGVPHRFGYFHGILSLAILYLIIKRMGNNGALWSK
jgi:hypothetical protein